MNQFRFPLWNVQQRRRKNPLPQAPRDETPRDETPRDETPRNEAPRHEVSATQWRAAEMVVSGRTQNVEQGQE
jgi:hypothetical protein